MGVFYFEFIFIGVLWGLSSFNRNKLFIRVTKILSYGSLLFLTCFRASTIDPDTPMYLNYFRMFGEMSWKEVIAFNSIEIGDCILFKLIGSVWLDERFFIIVMSCITTIPIFIFIEKKSKNIFLSLLIFLAIDFWFGTMYIMRQYTAISFCLLALVFIDKKGIWSFLWFTLWTFVAILFHYSAIFFIPVYFLKFLKADLKTYLLFSFLFIVCIISGREIISFLNRFARISYDIKYTGGNNLLLFFLIIAIIIPVLDYSLLRRDRSFSLFYIMFLYCIVIQALALSMENMTRAARYAMLSILIVFPNFIEDYMNKKKNREMKIIVNPLLFVGFALFFVISIGNHSISGYEFMWG